MQISRYIWAHPVDTEQWHRQEHFGLILTSGEIVFSKQENVTGTQVWWIRPIIELYRSDCFK